MTTFKAALLAATLFLAPMSALAQTPPPAAYAPPPGAVEEFATLRDGVKLAANVFKPQGTGPWPVVLSRTPYLKDGRGTPDQLAAAAKKYTDAGYVFVLQDVRGKGRSEGFYQAYCHRHRGRLRQRRVGRQAALVQRPRRGHRGLGARGHLQRRGHGQPAPPEGGLCGGGPL